MAKTALVTGASRGIGRAIALELAKQKINVVVHYNNNDVLAAKLIEEIKSLGAEAIPVKADISSFDECAVMAHRIKDKFGSLDIVVNNAGVIMDKTLKNLDKASWDEVMKVNLDGVFNVTKNVLDLMKDEGRIVNISSLVGINGNFGQTNYAASKAGLIGFTKSLAKELGKRKITVNAVAPGFIETDMTKTIPFVRKKIITAMIPLARTGKVEDVASLVGFLVSDSASYITGEVIRVDGGLNF